MRNVASITTTVVKADGERGSSDSVEYAPGSGRKKWIGRLGKDWDVVESTGRELSITSPFPR